MIEKANDFKLDDLGIVGDRDSIVDAIYEKIMEIPWEQIVFKILTSQDEIFALVKEKMISHYEKRIEECSVEKDKYLEMESHCVESIEQLRKLK